MKLATSQGLEIICWDELMDNILENQIYHSVSYFSAVENVN